MKVFVTRTIPDAGLEILKNNFDVTVNSEDRPITMDKLIDSASGSDGILCLLTDRIDDKTMDHIPNLKGIANYAVGFDNIDIDAATKRGIPVSNTPGVLTDATADLTIALIFAVARRIVEAETFLRDGTWSGWGPMQFLGADVSGETLGIIGMGKIGYAVAKRASGLGMKIVYYDTKRNEAAESELDAEMMTIPSLLSSADFVTLHIPLFEKTRHLIGKAEFEMMKQTAFLINTSRGPVVDEVALATALKEGEISGAGLDVYEFEPEVTEELLALKNVVLLPHIGSATTKTRSKMAVMAAENLVAMLKGGEIPNLVNPDYIKHKK